MHCTADQLGNDSQTSCPDPRGSTSALSLPGCPSDGGSLDNARVKLFFDEPQFSITAGQAAVWYDGDMVLAESLKTDKLVHRLKQSQLNQRRDLSHYREGIAPHGVQLVNRIATPEQRQEFLDQADFLPRVT